MTRRCHEFIDPHTLCVLLPSSPHFTDEKLSPESKRVTCRPHSTSGRARIKTKGSGPSRVVGAAQRRHDPALTLAGAEAEPAVGVIVGRGAAPGRVVGAAVRGAGGVGAALEGKGEVAGGAI